MLYWLDGHEVAVALVEGLLVGVLHDDELELGAGHGDEAEVGGPLHLGGEDGPRRLGHRGVVGPGQVALDHDGGGLVGQQADRLEVEDELHVAVPLLPRGDGVAVDGVHVHVDAEQVVAALGLALAQHVVEEVAAVQALARQAPLHVGEGDHDGVDLVLLDGGAQRLLGQVPVVSGHGGTSEESSAGGPSLVTLADLGRFCALSCRRVPSSGRAREAAAGPRPTATPQRRSEPLVPPDRGTCACAPAPPWSDTLDERRCSAEVEADAGQVLADLPEPRREVRVAGQRLQPRLAGVTPAALPEPLGPGVGRRVGDAWRRTAPGAPRRAPTGRRA